VAYRQLQKLENLGLLERNPYGEYVVKEKTSISGHLWIGRNLVPRLVFYSFFFMGILGAEIAIIAAQLFFYGQSLDMEIFYLIAITAIAMSMFLGEGILLHRKTRPEKQTKD
jgi:ABC-type transport system involved in cytochrome c biogenesis permease subunit